MGFEKTQSILRGKGYSKRGVHWNLGTGCGIFWPVCREFGVLYILTANGKQSGERIVVATIKANYLNSQVTNR